MAKKMKEKTKAPDYLADVVQAVTNYDDVRLNRREIKGETLKGLHVKAVKLIAVCNNNHGEGHTSISKARTLIQMQYFDQKIKGIMETTKCTIEDALSSHRKRQSERKESVS